MARGAKTGGRAKGTPNKTTALLKDAILAAAEIAGDGNDKPEGFGLTKYLLKQAKEQPTGFMALLGKVLPMQVVGDADNPVAVIHKIERVIVDHSKS